MVSCVGLGVLLACAVVVLAEEESPLSARGPQEGEVKTILSARGPQDGEVNSNLPDLTSLGEDDVEEEEEEEEEVGERHGEEFGKPRKQKLDNPPSWKDTDLITVYYGEFLLSAWVLDHAPWNAYHSGLAFHNNNTGEKCLYDYAPDDTSSTTKLIFPEIHVNLSDPMALVHMFLFGEANVKWNNHAHMTLNVGGSWPSHFTNFVELGTLSGKQFQQYAKWVDTEFQGEVFTFDPYEILVLDDSNGTVVVKEKLGSQMCHDFVSNSLWGLYNNGVRFQPKSLLFRDHIIVYASEYEPRPDLLGSPWKKRSMLRFYRTCLLYLEKIKKQFTFGRETLNVVWKLGIPAIVYTKEMYYQVKLAPPFLNYCYLGLAIPPAVHDPLTANKLCALGITADFTNTSMPVPYGLELGVEEQLDQPTVVMSFFMVVVAAALPAIFSRSH